MRPLCRPAGARTCADLRRGDAGADERCVWTDRAAGEVKLLLGGVDQVRQTPQRELVALRAKPGDHPGRNG